MGNVPISCCRSHSPRLNHESRGGNSSNNNETNKYSSSEQRRKHSEKSSRGEVSSSSSYFQQRNQNILQHISEREPDDSETDPSLNPLNRPIFASRSSTSRGCNANRTSGLNFNSDSYSSNSSIRKQSTNTPLTSSQDQGYNSCTSTNLTQFSGNLTNISFDSGIHKSTCPQQQQHTPNQYGQSDELNNISSTGTKSFLQLDGCNDDTPNSHSTQPDEFSTSPGTCRKASSCSTIFINDSTISQPNLEQTIRCVSLAIYYHIKNRSSDASSGIFDESIHPLKMPVSPPVLDNMHDRHDQLIMLDNQIENSSLDEPDQDTIYNFVRSLFKAAQLTSEYAITTLVYLERLMTYAEMDLAPKTWRRMFLGAILLSSKVWEDHAVWNVDYAQILDEISVDDINELERQFLELIEFNMNVPSSVYAKYYFHLRTLALLNGLGGELSLLTVSKARELEAKSNVYATVDWLASPIHRRSSPSMKRHNSLEKLRLCGHSRAVLM